MRESRIERFLVERVRAVGGVTIKLVPVHAGIPDRLVIFPGGRFFFVELKAPSGRLSEVQKVWHARSKRLGAPVSVIWSPDQVVPWIREVFTSEDPPDRAIPGPKPKCPTCRQPTR